MSLENGVSHFLTEFQLQFTLENGVRYLEKDFGYFRLKKMVVNSLEILLTDYQFKNGNICTNHNFSSI